MLKLLEVPLELVSHEDDLFVDLGDFGQIRPPNQVGWLRDGFGDAIRPETHLYDNAYALATIVAPFHCRADLKRPDRIHFNLTSPRKSET